jgi:hypothetical protein
MRIFNNTITGNTAGISGGALFVSEGGISIVRNSIIWGNDAPDGKEIRIGREVSYFSDLTLSYCNLEGGQSAIHVGPGSTLNWGEGMFDADPLFVDAPGGDYHLSAASPCINRGINDDELGSDFDGDIRPYMGTVDPGADEFIGLHPLELELFTLSASGGGDMDFAIDAGAVNANRSYVLLGTLSGTGPGYGLPGGMILPLNWDGFTDLIVMYLNNTYFLDFMGKLDASGQGNATLHVPGLFPIWVGEIMQYAYTLHSPFDFVSNPVAIEIVP